MSPRIVDQLPDLPERPDDGHKGTFGRVGIIAGNRGMSGAAVLSGLGALRSGAGLVTVAVAESILSVVAASEPSFLTLPLPEDEQGRLSADALSVIIEKLSKSDVLAIGPGLGQSDDVKEIVRKLVFTAEMPLVVDADGLNSLVGSLDQLSQRSKVDGHPPGRVLTPHPGEMSRLTGLEIGEIQNNRESVVVEFAEQHDVVLLLKGRETIISDGQRVAVNRSGNSGMATGGTGDVLTGVIAALLAQGMEPFDAARMGAHLHGVAGELVAEEISEAGLISSDLPRAIGRAWKLITTNRR